MARKTHNGSPGLWTGANAELSPPGALLKAQGTVIKRPGLIEKRRPYEQIAIGADRTGLFTSVCEHNGGLYSSDENSTHDYIYYTASLSPTGAWTQISGNGATPKLGRFIPRRAIEINRVLYDGVFKIDADGGTPYLMGIGKPKDPTATLATATSGILGANIQRGYRVVFGILDAKGNLALSAPSGRVLAINTLGSAATATIKTLLPPQIAAAANATSYFYQVYATAVPSVASTDPGDEMQIVQQATLTALDVSNGYVSWADINATAPGAALYTNASQEGIEQANYQPPACSVMALFKGALFFGNTTQKYQARVQALGIPTQLAISAVSLSAAGQATYTFGATADLTGIDATMKLAVTGTAAHNGNWTVVSVNNAAHTILAADTSGAAAAGAVGTAMSGRFSVNTIDFIPSYDGAPANSFVVTTSGSDQSNVANTYKALVNAINNWPVTGVSVFNESGPDDAAAKLLFEENTLAGTTVITLNAYGFNFASTKFNPALASLSTAGAIVQTPIVSQSGVAVNRLYRSKQGQPEHVPIDNYDNIGSGTRAILALTPLRDSMLVWKEDGLFRVTGDGAGNFFISPYDLTVVLTASGGVGNSVTVASNKAYAFTNKGILAVGDTGIACISDAVADKLAQVAEGITNAPVCSVQVNERDAMVYFGARSGNFATTSWGIGLAYCIRTQAWTERDGSGGGDDVTSFWQMPGFTSPSTGLIYRYQWIYVPLHGGAGVYREVHVEPADTRSEPTIGAPLPMDRHLINVTSVPGTTSIVVSCYADSYGNEPFLTRDLTGCVFYATDALGAPSVKVTVLADSAPTSAVKTLTLDRAVFNTSGANGIIPGRNWIYVPWSTTVEWVPYTAGEDALSKRFGEFSVLLDPASTATAITLKCYTEAASLATAATFTATTNPGVLTDCRALVPLTMQLCRRLSVQLVHSAAAEYLFIRSVSYEYEMADGRGVT